MKVSLLVGINSDTDVLGVELGRKFSSHATVLLSSKKALTLCLGYVAVDFVNTVHVGW